jgi:hypothetical protein
MCERCVELVKAHNLGEDFTSQQYNQIALTEMRLLIIADVAILDHIAYLSATPIKDIDHAYYQALHTAVLDALEGLYELFTIDVPIQTGPPL